MKKVGNVRTGYHEKRLYPSVALVEGRIFVVRFNRPTLRFDQCVAKINSQRVCLLSIGGIKKPSP